MRFALTCFFLITTFHLHSQSVGLVLSGGGAKGAAHVGVIKALEEEGIPIDYIVGTSMGAVVGAFYAAGYSPDEIEAIIKAPVFLNWIQGTSTEKFQYNYVSAEDDASWINLDLLLDAKNGPSLNTPIANDIIINFVLNEYLSQAAQSADLDFNRLFVPFKAIAADVFTQRVLPLDSGAMMEAVRSSMAVPLFYRPIKFNNQYLFDGGIYDNFPVDVMQAQFAPDIIIGSNVATKKNQTYPYNEDEAIVNNAMLFMFLDKADTSILGPKNILIEPNVGSYTAVDFDKVGILLDSGYLSVRYKIDEVKRKISARVSREELVEKRNAFRSVFEPYSFGALSLRGFNTDQEKFVRKLIDFNEGKQDIDQIRKAYLQLVSEPYFKNIYPSFSYDKEQGHYVLQLFLKPTARNALSLSLGGNLSMRQVSTLQLGIKLNSFNRKLNTYKISASTGRFYESVRLGVRFNLNPKTRFFLEPALTYNQWDYFNIGDVLSEWASPVLIDRTDRKLGLTLGLGSGERSVVTLKSGLLRNTDFYSNNNSFSSNDILDDHRLIAFFSNLAYERNSLDKKQFATKGNRFYSALKYIGGRSDFQAGSTSTLYDRNNTEVVSDNKNWVQLTIKYDEYQQISSKSTFGFLLQAQYSSLEPFNNYRGTLLYLPAFEPLFDSETYFLEGYRAQGYLAGGLRYIRSLSKSLDFRTEIYAMSAFKSISPVNDQSVMVNNGFQRPLIMGMTALVYETVVGPLSFRINYIQENNVNLGGVMLSFGYLIFNQKSHE